MKYKKIITVAAILFIACSLLLLYISVSSIPDEWEYPKNIDANHIYSISISSVDKYGKYTTTEIDRDDFTGILSALNEKKDSEYKKCLYKKKYYSTIAEKELVITIAEGNGYENWQFVFYSKFDNALVQGTKNNECYISNMDALRELVYELADSEGK